MADLITTMGSQEIPGNCSAIHRELLLSFVRLMAIRIRLAAAEEAFGQARLDLAAGRDDPANCDVPASRGAATGIATGYGSEGDQARAMVVNSMAALAIRSGADVGAVGRWMASVRDPHEGLADLAAIVRAGQSDRSAVIDTNEDDKDKDGIR
jgi:hypothetical protein